MARLIPGWLAHYPKDKLGADIAAGLIVTILVIPQSLAYALLAGLPPQLGLYVSIFPVIAYALLGSSMVQAVGPVAITAIMTYSVLSPIAPPGSSLYITLAAALSLLSGLMLLACGALRLGFLSQLLSRPVISGFISGSAVLIIISQLKYLTGVVPHGSNSGELLLDLLEKLPQAHLPTLTIGLLAFGILAIVRLALADWLVRVGLSKAGADFIVRLMPLVVVIVGTLAVIEFNLDHGQGVAVVGSVVAGLPGFTFFVPGLDTVHRLLLPAFVMMLIGMVQSITMAQALAIKRRERIDPNAELVGLGAANVVAGFYGGMPVGGGLSRSAINVAAGAQTPLASILSALAMIGVVAGAAQWFERLPLAVLAASIMMAAISMIDLQALRQAWSYDRADALALLCTAGGVLLFGLEAGIGMGIVLSMATLLYRTSVPHIAVVGRVPGTEHFRNVARYEVETLPGVLFVRIDERLFFGNLGAVEQRLTQELERVAGAHDLVLVMSGVNLLDTTAVEVFGEINQDLAERGIKLHLAEVKGPVQDRLMKSSLWKALTGEVFLSANAAYEKLAPPEVWCPEI
ncbi:SulP family inorganic anion transporter [Ferribacterium limneticum]|uniref:SulP family inorganic anion transporter n=1 Tax=Ferribacterium limneticum TaxID=76259 RepID=UPI001CFBDE27|nr:SulP family inorganic anion transporter [Ferribacterium limneticum]UCV17422.1 SulP family inorganic anion transporter [Ferribacterium limneticum]